MKTSHVEMIGHASIRLRSGGKTLLFDPWYVDPINCNAIYHWPPLVHDPKILALETDVMYISHVHPDHFDPRTLEFFDRKIPIYIGRYEGKAFYNELRSLGFQNVFELSFQELTKIPGTDFEICIFESDYAESAAYDSSIFVRTPEYTLFNNNDCLLDQKKYEWLSERHSVDYAFLGYSHASFFPVCFEFEAKEKKELLQYWGNKHYDQFVQAAEILKPKMSFPFAMGIRFLDQDMLWQNMSFNCPSEAVRRLEPLALRGEILNPGDVVLSSGQIHRKAPLLVGEAADRALEEYAQSMQAIVKKNFAAELPARPNLIESFRDQVLNLWRTRQTHYPEVKNNVIAYEITGDVAGEFYFDFSKPEDQVFNRGKPAQFDMRYRYPDRLLQLKVDGVIDWDELNFSNRLSVKQVRYAASYYSMLRSEGDLLSRKHL